VRMTMAQAVFFERMPSVLLDVAIIAAASAVNCVADVAAQWAEFSLAHKPPGPRLHPRNLCPSTDDPFAVDWPRVGRWLVWPTIPSVVAGYYIYGTLVPMILGKELTFKTMTVRLLLRAIAHANGVLGTIVGNRLLSGDRCPDIGARLREHFLPCTAWVCALWLPADVVQFTLIPPQLQILWICSYRIVVGVVVSYYLNLPLTPPRSEDVASDPIPRGEAATDAEADDAKPSADPATHPPQGTWRPRGTP